VGHGLCVNDIWARPRRGDLFAYRLVIIIIIIINLTYLLSKGLLKIG